MAINLIGKGSSGDDERREVSELPTKFEEAKVAIEVLGHDPFMQLTRKYAESLTGNTDQMQAIASQVSQESARNVATKEEEFRKQGWDIAADELQKCLQLVVLHLPDLVKVRDANWQIGNLLVEILSKVRDGRLDAVPALIEDMKKIMREAGTITEKSRDDFSNFQNDLTKRTKQINTSAANYSCAKSVSGMSGCLAGLCSSLGFGLAKFVQQSRPDQVAKMPCSGFFTKTTSGWFGASSLSIKPGSALLLAGCASTCCVGALGCCACSAVFSRKRSTQRALAEAMVLCRQSAQFNMNMWKGIQIFCTQAIEVLMQMPEMNADRHDMWERRMKDFGHRIIMLGQSVDLFIIALEQCGQVPQNYNVAGLLGVNRYQLLRDKMRLMETPKRPGCISRMRAKLWALPGLRSVYKAVDHQAGPGVLPSWAATDTQCKLEGRIDQLPSHSPTCQALPPAGSQATHLIIPTSALQREENVQGDMSDEAGADGSQSSQASDAGLSDEEDTASRVLVQACFPSSTVFQREDGTKVRAAELRGTGGDVLMGPGGSRVRFLLASTHYGQNRSMVRVRTKRGMLFVTADHRLIMEDARGEEVDMVAHGILPRQVRIGQGQGFQRVTSVDPSSEIMDFVEVTFENDASVLAWSPEKRCSRSLNLQQAFVVRGTPHKIRHHYLGENKTFLGKRALQHADCTKWRIESY